MSQTALTENAPMILDATCSYRKLWPKKATIRIDIRPEVHPDLVMDAKDLKFPDSSFDAVYCDPPHLIRRGQHVEILRAMRVRSGRLSPGFFERYGVWEERANWLDFVARTNLEFARVLKPNGRLFYKITDGDSRKIDRGTTRLSELLEGMTKFEVTEDRITASQSRLNTSCKVHWLTMKPKAKAEGKE